ncbi:MazG-like family protein [Micromonospora schwarzwaldensis]|uniref:MazG-like family protein n=1 Tax=Micromonospora sp. DSM 45708 TaxID=3111767 RepID=UPI0031CE408C
MTVTTPALFDIVAKVAARLDAINGRSREETGLRILKVTEEAGEVAAAWIGTLGQNPRKGVTHTSDDVAAELADVVLTALVAIASLGHDPQQVIAACVAKVTDRLDGSHRTPPPARDPVTDPVAVDPAAVVRYGDQLHEAVHGIGCDCRPQVRRQFRSYTKAIMAWLAADGRLS